MHIQKFLLTALSWLGANLESQTAKHALTLGFLVGLSWLRRDKSIFLIVI
jgi:hypothetical protein